MASSPPATSPLSPQPPRSPLIVILGATGTGKSNLALSLAKTLPSGAEIINCDAMQMYRSLPIITNKLPLSERQGVPHHLLDFIGLDETPWTVNKFVKESRRVIDGVRSRGKIPVMVGGTGYYVFGSLFKEGLLGDEFEEDDGTDRPVEGEMGDFRELREILNATNEEMLKKLMELDPEMARSWHPNDRRKIQRSLEICLKRGKKVSEIYRAQVDTVNDHEAERYADGGRDATGHQAGGLRYDPLLLWISASDIPLKARLDARVDQMVKDGLFEEALDLVRLARRQEEQGVKFDKSKGIWVSIGYKEMEPWATKHLEDPEQYPKDCKLALECIEAVKAGTRQYARRQERYIRIHMANALRPAGALDKVFLLDGTGLSRWTENVVQPAQVLVKIFLAGKRLPDPSSLNALAKERFEGIRARGDEVSSRVAHYCEVCDKTMMTGKEWGLHLASRSHKKVVQSKKRRALVALEGQAGSEDRERREEAEPAKDEQTTAA